MPLAQPLEPEKGQTLLGIGEIRTIDVGYLRPKTKTKPARVAFRWPGGVELTCVVEEDVLEVEMDAQADIGFKEAWHQIFVIELTENHRKIVSFGQVDDDDE